MSYGQNFLYKAYEPFAKTLQYTSPSAGIVSMAYMRAGLQRGRLGPLGSGLSDMRGPRFMASPEVCLLAYPEALM